jgi:hypothetical protein
MPYHYKYKAYFVSSNFNSMVLNTVIPTAVQIFNNLPRKNGHKKHINVSVNAFQRCLDIQLESDIQLDPVNYLRAIQFFCKVLSSQPGMAGYITNGRLLNK